MESANTEIALNIATDAATIPYEDLFQIHKKAI